MVPSSSMLIWAPVSSWIWLMTLPLGPITSPILSTGTFIVMMRGAVGAISSGASIASLITSRIVMRASRACFSAEDVGERHEFLLAVDLSADQAHGDAADRRAQRHPGIQQRHRGRADRPH